MGPPGFTKPTACIDIGEIGPKHKICSIMVLCVCQGVCLLQCGSGEGRVQCTCHGGYSRASVQHIPIQCDTDMCEGTSVADQFVFLCKESAYVLYPYTGERWTTWSLHADSGRNISPSGFHFGSRSWHVCSVSHASCIFVQPQIA